MNGIGIYAVKSNRGRFWVVIAPGADEAVRLVIHRSSQDIDVPEDAYNPDDYSVGRLGDYDPGNGGARMAIETGGLFG